MFENPTFVASMGNRLLAKNQLSSFRVGDFLKIENEILTENIRSSGPPTSHPIHSALPFESGSEKLPIDELSSGTSNSKDKKTRRWTPEVSPQQKRRLLDLHCLITSLELLSRGSSPLYSFLLCFAASAVVCNVWCWWIYKIISWMLSVL